MFHQGDLQSGIGLAVQQAKAVLCLIHDGSDASNEWENVLQDDALSPAITSQTIALRIQAESQEASFLTPIVAINSTPAVIIIKNAQLQLNLQSSEVSVQELKDKLSFIFSPQEVPGSENQNDEELTDESTSAYLDLQPAPGQMRLPNNAYDALRNYTETLLEQGMPHNKILDTQLSLLNNIPIFKDEVTRLQSTSSKELSEYARSRLLRLPAVGLKIPGQAKPAPPIASPSSSSRIAVPQQQASTPASSTRPPQNLAVTNPPSQATSDKQKSQRDDYIKLQREREQKQRDERERIKAQIKADREERRRLDEMRKGNMDSSTGHSTNASSASSYSRAQLQKKEVRIQVRTFDGSTLRSTFQPSSTLSADVRPWIDEESGINAPYNLKLILTPLPNRSIEASEEGQELSDLGIIGSCTLVMVPVKGYVESYTGSSTGGLLGSAVSGGFGLVTGTAGAVFGGVKSILGYGTPPSQPTSASASSPIAGADNGDQNQPDPSKVRVRTLADQRAESVAKRRDHQLYNGNQLNFEPKKDGDGGDDQAGLKRD
ncbi:hypothetical protein LTR84_005407 [Exophiala bonariae]|uniref:UBX domain-containing protein n=1 Tax=Exophiala bonariae TaxID=1690606 RepID=A0AAV9N4I9_9EURO|nr:hypothetical protein LTR84_005407 [Exophiala bonariae]